MSKYNNNIYIYSFSTKKWYKQNTAGATVHRLNPQYPPVSKKCFWVLSHKDWVGSSAPKSCPWQYYEAFGDSKQDAILVLVDMNILIFISNIYICNIVNSPGKYEWHGWKDRSSVSALLDPQHILYWIYSIWNAQCETVTSAWYKGYQSCIPIKNPLLFFVEERTWKPFLRKSSSWPPVKTNSAPLLPILSLPPSATTNSSKGSLAEWKW